MENRAMNRCAMGWSKRFFCRLNCLSRGSSQWNGLSNKYSPIDSPTSFPYAFALHATNASQAISYPLKSTKHARQKQRNADTWSLLCLRAKTSLRSSRLTFPRFGSDRPRTFRRMESILNQSNKTECHIYIYIYKSPLTSVRDLSRRRRGTRRTRWLAARRRK